jgi:nuclear transport factor 2 (NTF2) superfamily protein
MSLLAALARLAAPALGLVSLSIAPVGGARGEGTHAVDVTGWLARYEKAWESRDPDLAASLFTADATYHEMPFDAPLAGREAIRQYWARVTADQRDVDFRAKPIVESGSGGVAEWTATFRSESSGATIELSGVFVLEFDRAGLCTSLREWWHVRQR